MSDGGAEDWTQHRAQSQDDIVYDRFSDRVCARLGFYVYRLVDPRDGETFYVGRGVQNRIFDHIDEAADAAESGRGSAKTDRINAIHRAGWRVATVIHRHALRDQDEASTLEAALIEAYPNLTNQVAGAGTREFGQRATDSMIKAYDLPPARFQDHACLLLSLTDGWPREADDEPTSWTDLYARARHGWALDVDRARRADWIVAHARGLVRAVFKADEWRSSDDPVFAAFPKPDRRPSYGFVGRPAPLPAWRAWAGRRVPETYRSRWGQRVRYVNI